MPCRGFSALLQAFGTHDYRACATSAMREASNGGQIAELVRNCSGISIEIINGETEADTIFAAGGLKETLDPQKPISTSMSEAVVSRSLSTPAVARSRPARSDWGPCVSSAAQRPWPNGRISREWLREVARTWHPSGIIGSGGNINKTHKLLEKKSRECIHAKELNALYNRLRAMSCGPTHGTALFESKSCGGDCPGAADLHGCVVHLPD